MGENSMVTFVQGILGSVTDVVTLADVALIVAAIIGGGITIVIAWKFARKGYNFIVSALSGRGGKL